MPPTSDLLEGCKGQAPYLAAPPARPDWPEWTEAEWPRWAGKPLDAAFPALPPSGHDLLRRLLHYDPALRITAADALQHPYFASVDTARVGTAPLPEMAAARLTIEAQLKARWSEEELAELGAL